MGLVKINCDGASQGNPGISACGGIARDFDGRFLGAFARFLAVSNFLIAKINGAMFAIEFAHEKDWRNIWLETDSVAVIRAFSPPFNVPWKIRTRWINCVNITTNMSFLATHIYKQGNSCADSLANKGLTVSGYTNFIVILDFLRADFVKNKLAFPFFRFCSR